MDEDEWFFNSFKRYNELQMFDFPRSVTEMDLTYSNNLCVALEADSSAKNEVLVFNLPSALQRKSDSECSKLERHLSFDHGYFTDSPIVQLKCTALEDNLIISEKNGVALFNLTNKENDIIKKISNIPGDVKCALIAISAIKHFVVLCDGEVGHRSVVDYEKMNTVLNFEDSSKERTVPMLSSCDVVCFGETISGRVTSYDIRNGKQINSVVVNDFIDDSESSNSKWIFSSTFDYSRELTSESFLYAWCNDGHLMLFDWRKTSKPILYATYSICCRNNDNCGRQLSVCPLNINHFTLSGFDENVYVSELKNNEVNTIFTHDGHSYCRNEYEPNVKTTCSMWLPFISPNTLISCASNASVQCWQYKVA